MATKMKTTKTTKKTTKKLTAPKVQKLGVKVDPTLRYYIAANAIWGTPAASPKAALAVKICDILVTMDLDRNYYYLDADGDLAVTKKGA